MSERTKRVVARKHHTCAICQRRIHSGDLYSRTVVLPGDETADILCPWGKPETYRAHIDCFTRDHPDATRTPDSAVHP